MKVLGISELDNDSGAVLFLDGHLVAAASEERFTRVKMQRGFPRRAVAWLLRTAALTPRDLDVVVVVKPEPADEVAALAAATSGHDFGRAPGPWLRRSIDELVFRAYKPLRGRLEARRYGREVDAWIEASGVPRSRLVRAGHHRAHAASAFFASGLDRALAVTCDGQGGGVTAAVYRGEGATLRPLHEVKLPHSMGFFYAMVTRALGFRPSRHEGKVTGLAAYEPADAEALALFRDIARATGPGFETPGVYGALLETRRLVRRCGRAPVAAAAQLVLEEVLARFVAHWLAATGERGVVLAGGVFANVRLNQRIHELPGVDRLFVFPHMGDGGLGFGAVADLLAETQGRKSRAVDHVYWGPAHSDADIEAALVRAGVAHRRVGDVESRVVETLARGGIVARFAGRMEFGPRALGNRSILCPAVDPDINRSLNRRLRRTEFMPFAPVVLAEDAPRLVEGLAGAEHAAEFMTVTFRCSPALRAMAPAVVHVDGTARPQLLRAAVNPPYAEILRRYRDLTGVAALVNTSFNCHEEPIVQGPQDAVQAFLDSGLDALAIGPFYCERRP